jgi:hypothetical protein
VIHNRLARAALSLAVGFGAAFVVIQAVERLGPSDRVGRQIVLGIPDLRGYCERDQEGLIPLLVAPDPYAWECAGPISNIWTTTVIDFDAVCQWQHNERARSLLIDPSRPEVAWRCVIDA